MGASMIRRVNTQYCAVVFLITLCQVIATVCTLHDHSAAAGVALLEEEGMACPMGETTMCPSSLTSSPERLIKHNMVSDVDPAQVLLSFRQFLLVLRSRCRGPRATCYPLFPSP